MLVQERCQYIPIAEFTPLNQHLMSIPVACGARPARRPRNFRKKDSQNQVSTLYDTVRIGGQRAEAALDDKFATNPDRGMRLRSRSVRGSWRSDCRCHLLLQQLSNSRAADRTPSVRPQSARCGWWNVLPPVPKGSRRLRERQRALARIQAYTRLADAPHGGDLLQFRNAARVHERALAHDVSQALSEQCAAHRNARYDPRSAAGGAAFRQFAELQDTWRQAHVETAERKD